MRSPPHTDHASSGRLGVRQHRADGRSRIAWFDWMLLPTLLVLGVVIGYPTVSALVLSTQKYNVVSAEGAEQVGLRNYEQIAQDPIFREALGNTAIYTFGSVAIAALAGLALALLTENLSGRWRAIRTILLTPWAVPAVVVAFLFRYMFEDRGGIINALLLDLGLLDKGVGWLTSSSTALFTVVATNVWTQVPFFFLVFSAALAAIPVEILEAARVDRAGTWPTIFHIKLPFVRNAFIVGSLIMVIANFNDFGKIWAMTEGGPGYASTTLVLYVYRLAFQSFDLGYASAVGVVWLVFLLLFAVVYVRSLERKTA